MYKIMPDPQWWYVIILSFILNSSLHQLSEVIWYVSWYKWTNTWFISWYILSYTSMGGRQKMLGWNKIKWSIIIKNIETCKYWLILCHFIYKKYVLYNLFLDLYNFNTTNNLNWKQNVSFECIVWQNQPIRYCIVPSNYLYIRYLWTHVEL